MDTERTERTDGPRRRGPSERVGAAVVAATLAELAEVGYPRLTMERVAERAGVHRTTLYRRWGSRERMVLEAMLDLAGRRIPVPDTGSLRADLIELARSAAANAAAPEVAAMARAVASGARDDAALATANHHFWTRRLALDGQIVERAVARGEVSAEVDPRCVIESVLGPIHLRLLLTGEPIDRPFLEGVVDVVVSGATGARPQRAP